MNDHDALYPFLIVITFAAVVSATALARVGAIGNGGGGGFVMNPMLPDGITDGSNTIQGVRNYDTALGAWTTPDAYAGEVGDPMSQKSFMWNRDNPAEYSDPTDFDPLPGVGPAHDLARHHSPGPGVGPAAALGRVVRVEPLEHVRGCGG